MTSEFINYAGALEQILVVGHEILYLHVLAVDYKFELFIGLCVLGVVDDAAEYAFVCLVD